MDQSRYGQAAEPYFMPIQRSAESDELFQRIMNFEPYHVKGIEEDIKNDEFFPQDMYTRFSSHRSMEERQQYQWQQQYSSPIEKWEYDQQLWQ